MAATDEQYPLRRHGEKQLTPSIKRSAAKTAKEARCVDKMSVMRAALSSG